MWRQNALTETKSALSCGTNLFLGESFDDKSQHYGAARTLRYRRPRRGIVHQRKMAQRSTLCVLQRREGRRARKSPNAALPLLQVQEVLQCQVQLHHALVQARLSKVTNRDLSVRRSSERNQRASAEQDTKGQASNSLASRTSHPRGLGLWRTPQDVPGSCRSGQNFRRR